MQRVEEGDKQRSLACGRDRLQEFNSEGKGLIDKRAELNRAGSDHLPKDR